MTNQVNYPEINWTKREYHQLILAIKHLQDIVDREAKRHMMNQQLDSKTIDTIEEVIAMLQEEVDYDPTPSEGGEPPMTASEMHSAAWNEHQEAHR